jgi:hypothetical protein
MAPDRRLNAPAAVPLPQEGEGGGTTAAWAAQAAPSQKAVSMRGKCGP